MTLGSHRADCTALRDWKWGEGGGKARENGVFFFFCIGRREGGVTHDAHITCRLFVLQRGRASTLAIGVFAVQMGEVGEFDGVDDPGLRLVGSRVGR